MKLRYPNFTGRNAEENLRQLEGYLRYLVDVLNLLMK